ncbi:hypothetical protein [Streptomyces minutiscleroticus]|uniref:hypothetical protein n=1 Tax=Streptomyces minutiscleroticus TaxID=68238 RepID=UPI003323C8FC
MLLPLVGGAFLVVLSEPILGVAVPSIMRDLDVSASTAQWAANACMPTMATAIPAGGSCCAAWAPGGSPPSP